MVTDWFEHGKHIYHILAGSLMIGLIIIIIISLFAHVENYFDSTTMSQVQIIMNISLQY